MPKSVITNSPDAGSKKSIKFNMAHDEAIRSAARSGYEIAKVLKEAGLKFKRVVPAYADISIKKLFKLGPKSDHLCLEISTAGKTEEQKIQDVEDIKDQFLMMPEINLIDDRAYKYEKGNNVHRFLFRFSKQK